MKQLARLRRLRGFSQRALAKEGGVSPATIYELENGRREPNPSTLRKLAGALEVEVADLIEEPEAPKGGAPSSEVKGPDPEVWGDPSEREDPATARMPEAHGRHIHVWIEGGEVTITEQSFLEVLREVRRGAISPEEAVDRVRQAG